MLYSFGSIARLPASLPSDSFTSSLV